MRTRIINLVGGPIVAGVVLATVVAGPTMAGQLITGAQIALETITGANVKDGSLTGADLASGTVGTMNVMDDSLTGADIKDGGIGSADIATGGVASVDVLDNSLTGADINESTLSQVPSAADSAKLGGSMATSYLKTKEPLVRVAFYRFVTAWSDGSNSFGCRVWSRSGLPAGAMVLGFSTDPGVGGVATMVNSTGVASLRACNNQVFPNDGKAYVEATADITWYVFLP